MLRVVAATGLLLVAALLQSLMGPSLPVVNSRPDFVLIVVVAWAMLRGSTEGAVVGFIGGIFLDSIRSGPFGLNAALLGIGGYAMGLIETNMYRGNLPFFLGSGALITLLYHVCLFLSLQAFGNALPPVAATIQLAVPAALMNAALLLPAFLLCRRVLRSITGWRELQV